MPTGPLNPRPLKVALPPLLVVAVVVPISVTPAGDPVIVAVTTTLGTALLEASRSRRIGWVAKACAARGGRGLLGVGQLGPAPRRKRDAIRRPAAEGTGGEGERVAARRAA